MVCHHILGHKIIIFDGSIPVLYLDLTSRKEGKLCLRDLVCLLKLADITEENQLLWAPRGTRDL